MKINDDTYDVLIVGAGPAGLMAALAAAGQGASVLLCDRMPEAGQKLLLTGGGRCNLTNTADAEYFAEQFGRQGRFILPALSAMGSDALCAFFAGIGVDTTVEANGRVFPCDGGARAVQMALLEEARRRGVAFSFNTRIRELTCSGDAFSARLVGEERSIVARRVLLATGGKSYPSCGADGSGHALAEAFGHTLVPAVPALVSLMTDESWVMECAGLSLPVVVWVDLPKWKTRVRRGELLFTHRGVSGPVILDFSGDISSLLLKHESVPLRVNLVPALDADGWGERFDAWRRQYGRRFLRRCLEEYFPARLAESLLRQAGAAQNARPADCSRELQKSLITLFTALPLTVSATEGFEKAMVTRGGVRLKGVRPETLESRLVPGLFFAGELLDLDGPCGGFNLQWAFSSGWLAGLSAVGSLSSS